MGLFFTKSLLLVAASVSLCLCQFELGADFVYPVPPNCEWLTFQLPQGMENLCYNSRKFMDDLDFYVCKYPDPVDFEPFVKFVKCFIDYIFKEDMNGHFFYSIGPLLREYYNLISNPVGKQVLDKATKYCGSNKDEGFCPKFTAKKSQCSRVVFMEVPKSAYRSCRRYDCDEDKHTAYNDDYRLAEHVVCLMTHLENDTMAKEVFKKTTCHLEKKFTDKSSPGQKIDTAPIIEDLKQLCCFMTHLENDDMTKEVFKKTACYLEEKFINKSSPGQKIDTAPIIEDLNQLCNTLAN
ncbi:hypothetical protein ISCGN_022294 [Ixodes scapularis]